MPKPNCKSLLISLPLLGMSAALFAATPAQAAGAAEEAVRLLSKARAIDVKCHYLEARDRSDLSRFAARAEIAAASHNSPAAAKAAAARGRADAGALSCSPELRADVLETVDAARQAMAAANTSNSSNAGEPPVRRTGGSLGAYERIVSAYYLERQCRSLPRADADRFWKGVVKLHRQTVASNGARAVGQVMAAAEHRASGSSCAGAAEAQIEAGYREISGR